MNIFKRKEPKSTNETSNNYLYRLSIDHSRDSMETPRLMLEKLKIEYSNASDVVFEDRLHMHLQIIERNKICRSSWMNAFPSEMPSFGLNTNLIPWGGDHDTYFYDDPRQATQLV